MTTYPTLDWNSLDFVRSHLYRRLTPPLTHALGRLSVAQLMGSQGDSPEQIRRAGYSLEMALNLVKAWSALVHVKSGQKIQDDQRRWITPTTLPPWLVEYLNTQTAFKAQFQQTLLVHAETFFESLIMMAEIGTSAGALKMLLLDDAKTGGVWVRAVFDPPSSGAYTGLSALFQRLDSPDPAERERLTQLLVLQDLCTINGVCLRMQTNMNTGEQALAVQFAAHDAGESVPCGEPLQEITAAEQTQTAALPTLTPAEIAPETLIVPPPGLHEALLAMTEHPAPLAAAAQEGPSFAAPEAPTEPPKSAGIEFVEPQNPSDTLIIPPLELRRRLIERQLTQEDESAPAVSDEDTPAAPANP
jgi:hypothetical protein